MIQFLPLIWFGIKVSVLKTAVLSGFRLVENGFHGPATLEDLKKDKQFLTALGSDAAKLIPALTRLGTSNDLESVIISAHCIRRALDHLPEKTKAGLNESIGLEKFINAALAYALTRCGKSLLTAKIKDESITDGIKRAYYGLFLIGQSCGVLAEKDRTQAIMMLLHMHELRGNTDDLRVRAILQTWLPEKAMELGEALSELRESFELYTMAPPQMFKVYITSAIGGNMTATNVRNLLIDITEQYPEIEPEAT